jgi:hypothetical protein
MNERIKTLLEQVINDKFSKPWTPMSYQDLEKFAEYFAELIVQDCIGVTLNELVDEELIENEVYDPDRSYLNGNNGGVVDAVGAIKQHFGIK